MTRISRALMVGLLLAVTAGGCGTSWTQMKSRRITAYSDTPHYYTDTVEKLEYAYAALSVFFPKAEVGTVEVLMWPYVDRRVMGLDRGGLVFPGVPGGGSLGRNNLIVMGEDTTTGGYSTMLMTPLFLHKVLPQAPLWLHESLASYFTQTILQAGDQKMRACFGTLGRQGTFHTHIPLEKFFAVTWRTYPDSEPIHYQRTAQTLMEFILHGDGGAHLPKFPAILTGAAQQMAGPEIMASAFPDMTLTQLDKRLADFKGSRLEQKERGIVCPLPMVIPPERFPDESAPQLSPIPPEQINLLIEAIKKQPSGDRLPNWYPPDVLTGGTGVASPR